MIAGINQFQTLCGEFLISSNTSPGVANTFNMRAASELRCGAGGVPGFGVCSSMKFKVGSF
jgi:hypothetical protein